MNASNVFSARLRGLSFIVATAATLGATAGASAPAADGVFLDQGGLVAIEFEATDPADAWFESISTPGFVGDSYFRWDGADLFTSPGAAGVFGFDFEVDTAGTWLVAIRNRHEDPDPTEENDVWVRMDGGSWVKVFSNMPGSVGAWTWESRFDLDHNNQPDASYSLGAGVHRIEFSGRSNGFKMDRLHLHLPGNADANNPNAPTSLRRFGDAYCMANQNSTGQPSVVEAIGSPIASRNNVTLHCGDLPESALGYFVVSRDSYFLANAGGSSGNLCVGANTGRYVGNVLSSGTSGSVSLPIDTNAIPQPNGSEPAVAGDTWHFQFWHRDSVAGSLTSNFSRGLEINFE